jgi:hypothetical protein
MIPWWLELAGYALVVGWLVALVDAVWRLTTLVAAIRLELALFKLPQGSSEEVAGLPPTPDAASGDSPPPNSPPPALLGRAERCVAVAETGCDRAMDPLHRPLRGTT